MAFKREKDGVMLIYIANMIEKSSSFSIELNRTFEDYLIGETLKISKERDMNLKPWQYFILINK